LKVKGRAPLILSRAEAYIGVLIDDLVTKGTNEPYRMMTSRAEYRLLLRQDNADLRLTQKGYDIGLVTEERYKKYIERKSMIENEIGRIKKVIIPPTEENNKVLESLNSTPIKSGVYLNELLKRPEITYSDIIKLDSSHVELKPDVILEVQTQIKYEGYIKKQVEQVEQFKKMEEKLIPEDIDYSSIKGLRIEAKQKLSKIMPENIGQASRISGVSPADISVLLIYLEMRKRNTAEVKNEQ
ncbi:MAG TPA: tRNA uridine-5-carboxymethylaminomethyl(34) synthesis enzyme MnmG, partial [Clostridiaceae bacterium]|nr:tRNA uridine-5-carboxymethylaminomethyl(34) synthesis enzyme MnmG [Clostridiaceae bacterium]